MRTRPLPGIWPSHVRRGIEDHVGHSRRTAHHRDAVALDSPQDLGAVDLAQDDVLRAHARDRVQHAPAVAVELRQRVQVDVAVADAELPPERRRVQPDVAVRQLHALRSRRRAAGVVDRGGGVFVVRPRLRARRAAVARRSRCRSRSGARTRRRPGPRRAPGRRQRRARRSARRCTTLPRRRGGS